MGATRVVAHFNYSAQGHFREIYSSLAPAALPNHFCYLSHLFASL